jgi:CheY-like chemotaxis protein
MKKKISSPSHLIVFLSALFLLLAAAGLFFASRYIDRNLLQSGEATATDIALLVKNNFEITDEEVAYMKSLTFNEMEVDPINQRLMDVGNGVALSAAVSNVYLVAPLSETEYRYCPDAETADYLGFDMATPLDGVWLLNGRINEDGVFEVAQREDIFRYTVLDPSQRQGMVQQEPFGTFTSDAWGSFITGYAPIYTVEGSFVGLLGIDIEPDHYQASAQRMVALVIGLCAALVVLLCVLFVVFYLKYTRSRESQRKLAFYSEMSHEMRTPMNGILGMAEISKAESDVDALHRNVAEIESSGRHLLHLINQTLDYQGSGTPSPAGTAEEKTPPAPLQSSFPALAGKRLLLCEDNPLNAKITTRMLQHVGCSVETAADGQAGLDRFSASADGYFDAILMDIRMPVMDGLEATRRIRALARTDAATVPIIALTANSYEEDRRSTHEAGMNAHLTKPVEPELLYQTLLSKMISNNTPDGEGRKLQ